MFINGLSTIQYPCSCRPFAIHTALLFFVLFPLTSPRPSDGVSRGGYSTLYEVIKSWQSPPNRGSHCIKFPSSLHSPRRGPQAGYRTGGIRLLLKSRQSPPDRGSHCTEVFLGPSSLHSPRHGPQTGCSAGGIRPRMKS
jgi:hypothetical protein